jgi:DNA-binding MarR family transcriptional regulator
VEFISQNNSQICEETQSNLTGMKLEEEISQRKFRNEAHKLAVNIIYTFNWLNSYQSDFFKKYKITGQQFNVLRILRGQHPQPATIKILKERMLDKMSDASRIVEKLRLKGYVKREISVYDRRNCDVSISDKGLTLLAEIDKENDAMDKFLAALNDEEKKQLNDLLDKLRG